MFVSGCTCMQKLTHTHCRIHTSWPTTLSHTQHKLTCVNYATVSSKCPPWSNIDSQHTHTHLEGVYTYQIMTDHPFHCSVPPQGVVTTVSAQMRKEAAAHRRGIIAPADSFYFHVIRLLYFITPLQDCQVTFGQSFSRNCF